MQPTSSQENPCQTPLNCNAEIAVGDGQEWLRFVSWNGLLAAVLGAVAVTLPLGSNFAIFILWAILLERITRTHWQMQRPKFVTWAVMVQVSVMIVVVVAAHLAPVKTKERVLDRRVTVPKTKMTLAEIAGDESGCRPAWQLRGVFVNVPSDEIDQEIIFPQSDLTLRQFVDAVESQSTLRHRTATHCEHGWTILWGVDCGFGMHLRRPSQL